MHLAIVSPESESAIKRKRLKVVVHLTLLEYIYIQKFNKYSKALKNNTRTKTVNFIIWIAGNRYEAAIIYYKLRELEKNGDENLLKRAW